MFHNTCILIILIVTFLFAAWFGDEYLCRNLHKQGYVFEPKITLKFKIYRKVFGM